MSGSNKILLFLNMFVLALIVMVAMVYAWTNPSGNPPTGGGVLSYSSGNTTIGSNLTVTGNTSNTCTKVAYSYPGTTSCPAYYFVTTIADPTETGDMVCCKIDNP